MRRPMTALHPYQPALIGLDAAAPDGDTTVVTIGCGDAPLATLYCGDAYAIRPGLGFMDADVMDPPYLIRATGAGRYRKRRPNFDRLVANDLHRGFDMDIIDPARCGSAIVFAHNDQLAQLLARVQALRRH